MSLDPARFGLTEYLNSSWTVTVEAGTSLEDVLNPAFFANVAAKMHPYDHIRVRVDTGEYYAELLVLDCSRNWARTVILYQAKLSAEESELPPVDDQYEIKMLGAHKKWCVIRKSDKEAIKEQFSNRAEASAWLASHLKLV